MLRSNLMEDTGHPDLFLSWLFSQVNARILGNLGKDRLLSDPLQFVGHLAIRRYRVSALKASLIRPRK
jgi:hypothetical protein